MLPSLRSYNSRSLNYIDQLLLSSESERGSSTDSGLQAHGALDDEGGLDQQQQQQQLPQTALSRALLRNFIVFCIMYSIAHATVDGVLAFSAAELGASVGSDGSSLLYFFYTFASLLAARPAVRLYGAKRTVLIGLVGLLCYVSTFFIAISGGSSAVFLIGASVGGVGAGLLWTGQGSYYSINARAYAFAKQHSSSSAALANFASIFASTYLLLETLFKMFATIIYLAKDRDGAWKSTVFGLYMSAAFVSTICFALMVKNLRPRLADADAPGDEDENSSSNDAGARQRIASLDEELVVATLPSPRQTLTDSVRVSSSPSSPSSTFFWQDVLSVGNALYTNRRLQLLMPYQVCFGLSAGFVNSYMNAKVVAIFLGDGFIGLMSALSTLTAVILAWPYARIATTYKEHGKWYVMMTGGLCFLYSGLSVLCLTDEQMSSWPFLVSYFIIYGAGRSAWESTNKAVVADYFEPSAIEEQLGTETSVDERLKDSAFAAVYFMSGLAGAFGFVFYKFMTREQLAAVNTVMPLLALVSYHFSHLDAGKKRRDEEMDLSSATTSSLHRLTASSPLSSSSSFSSAAAAATGGGRG